MSKNQVPHDGAAGNQNPAFPELTQLDFIAHKRRELKVLKKNEKIFARLSDHLFKEEVKQFFTVFEGNSVLASATYLFMQNELKVTPLMDMLRSKQISEYISKLIEWSNEHLKDLNKILIFGETDFTWDYENYQLRPYGKYIALITREWGIKFTALTQYIIDHSEELINTGVLVSLMPLLEKSMALQLLYKNIKFQDIKAMFMRVKKENQIACLQDFFVPLFSLPNVKLVDIAFEMQQYRESLGMTQIWKDHKLYSPEQFKKRQFMQLDELTYTIFHEFAQKYNKEGMFNILQQFELDIKHFPVISRLLVKANNANETPIDIILRSWKHQDILQFFRIAKSYEGVTITTLSLNKILLNRSLSKVEKQQLMVSCLEGELSQKGYVQVLTEKDVVRRSNFRRRNQKIQNYVYSFDSSLLKLRLDGNRLYPLVTYLTLYREGCDLRIVEKLFLPQLERKTVKKSVLLIYKLLGRGNVSINPKAEYVDQINSLIDYVQPLLNILSKLKHGDTLQYLLSKTFINFCSIAYQSTQEKSINTNGCHFVINYIQNTANLEENKINKLIVKLVTQAKENQTRIKDFILFHEMLPFISRSHIFNQSKQYLPTAIKQHIKAYFNSLEPEQYITQEITAQDGVKHSIAKYLFPLNKRVPFYPFFTKEELKAKITLIDFEKRYLSQEDGENSNKDQMIGVREIMKIYQSNKPRKEVFVDASSKQIIYWKRYRKNPHFNNFNLLLDHIKTDMFAFRADEERIEDKIALLMRRSIDFCFVSSSLRNPLTAVVKNESTGRILKRMISQKSSFLYAIIHCTDAESEQIKDFLNHIMQINGQFDADNKIKCIQWISDSISRHSVAIRSYPRAPIGLKNPTSCLVLAKMKTAINAETQSQDLRVLAHEYYQVFESNMKYLKSSIRELYGQIKFAKNKAPFEKKFSSHIGLLQREAQKFLVFYRQHFFSGKNVESALMTFIKWRKKNRQENREQGEGESESGNMVSLQRKKAITEQQRVLIKMGDLGTFQFHSEVFKFYLKFGRQIAKSFCHLSEVIKNMSIGEVFLTHSPRIVKYQLNASTNPSKLLQSLFEIALEIDGYSEAFLLSLICQFNIYHKKRHYKHVWCDYLNEYQKIAPNESTFVEILDAVTMKEFQSIILVLREILCYYKIENRALEFILNRIKDPFKKAFIVKIFLQVIFPNCKEKLISLRLSIQPKCVQSSIAILLQHELPFDFKLQQGEEIVRFSDYNFFFKCDEPSFKILLNKIQGYLTAKPVCEDRRDMRARLEEYKYCDASRLKAMKSESKQESEQGVIKYLKEKRESLLDYITRSLLHAYSWARMSALLSVLKNNFAVTKTSIEKVIPKCIDIISGDSMNLDRFESNKAYQGFKQIMFQLLQMTRLPWDQLLFVRVYKIDANQAMRLMNPSYLNISSFYACLKKHPVSVRLLSKVPIYKQLTKSDPEESLPNFKKVRYLYPIVPYYYSDFSKKPYLAALLKQELALLKSCNFSNLLQKTMKCVCFVNDETLALFSQEQKQNHLKQILNDISLKSLLPFQKSFSNFKEQLKELCHKQAFNLQSSRGSIAKQLIDWGCLDRSHLFDVIRTASLEIVGYFLNKIGQPLTLQYIKQCQATWNQRFWLTLMSLRNADFIIEFIGRYKLFQLFKPEEYSKAVLHCICLNRANKVLEFVIRHIETHINKVLVYVGVEDQEAGYSTTLGQAPNSSQFALVKLPMPLATQMHYFEYFYLVKSSGNETPNLPLSFNYYHITDTSSFAFVPKLKKQIQLFNTICKILTQFNISYQGFLFEIMANIYGFNLNEKKQDSHSPGNKWKKDFKSLLDKIVSVKPNLTYETNFQVIMGLLINPVHCIPQKELPKIFPNDAKFVLALAPFFSNNGPDVVNLLELFNKNSSLTPYLLIYNKQMFFKMYPDALSGKIEKNGLYPQCDLIIYLQAVEIHLEWLLASQSNLLREFLRVCFFANTSLLNQESASLFLKRHALILIFLSAKIQPIFQELNGCGNEDALAYVLKIIFDLSNFYERVRFNAKVWEGIQEELEEIKTTRSYLKYEPYNRTISEESLRVKITNCLTVLRNKFSEKSITVENAEKVLEKCVKARIDLSDPFIQLTLYKNLQILRNEIYFYGDNLSCPFNVILVLKSQRQGEVRIENESGSSRISAELTYEVIDVKSAPTLTFTDTNLAFKIELKIMEKRIKANPNMLELDALCSDPLIHPALRGRKFILEFDEYLKLKLSDNSLMVESEINLLLKDYINELSTKLNQAKSSRPFSLSDIQGPIKINENTNPKELLHCVSFYELLPIPSAPLIVRFITARPNGPNKQEAYLRDIEEYNRYFLDQAISTTQNKVYNFKNIIYVFLQKSKSADESSQKFKLCTQDFSLHNIIEFHTLTVSSLSSLSEVFTLDFQISLPCLLQYYHSHRSLAKHTESVPSTIQRFIFSPSLGSFNQALANVITEDATTIIRMVRCVNFRYNFLKQESKRAYALNNDTSIVGVNYEVSEMVLVVTIDVYMKVDINAKQENQLGLEELVNRKLFLESIFSSTEFLTDYFVNKSDLNQECIKIARNLTKRLNTTINLHVAFEELYKYVDSQRKHGQNKIDQIDSYLHKLKNYILANLQSYITKYIASSDIANSHQMLVLNKFEAVHRGIPFEKVERSNFVLYNSKTIEEQSGLKQISGYWSTLQHSNDLANSTKEDLKNVYLIQIYKSHLSAVLSEGKIIIIGSKSAKKAPRLLRIAKPEHIQEINVNDLEYILLVSDSIPTKDQLTHSRIIRIFVSDLNRNIFLLSPKIQETLLALNENDDRKTADFVPIVASNLCLQFYSKERKIQEIKDSKIFMIQLKEDGKFHFQVQPSSKPTTLSLLKRSKVYRDAIDNFLTVLEEKLNCLIQVVVEPPTEVGAEDLPWMIKLACEDFENFLGKLFADPLRNPEVECILSVETKKILNNSCFADMRKDSFNANYKRIVFRFSNQESLKVLTTNRCITIEVGLSAGSKLVSANQILAILLEDLIVKKLATFPAKLIKSCQYSNLSPQLLLKIFDCLNILETQLKEIEIGRKLAGTIGIKKIPENTEISMGPEKTLLTIEGDKISLHWSVHSVEREFFTFQKVSEMLMSKKKEIYSENNDNSMELATQYSPEERCITVRNCPNSELEMLFYENGIWQKQKMQFIKSGQLMKSGVISPTSWIRYAVIMGQSVNSNYICSTEHLERAVKDKATDALICTEKYLILTSDCMVNLNFCPVTATIKDPILNNIFLQGCIMKPEFRKYMSLNLLAKNIVKLRISSELSSIISVSFGAWRQAPANDSLSCTISLASNGDICIANTKFLEIKYRGITVQIQEKDKQRVERMEIFKEPPETLPMLETFEASEAEVKNVQNLVYVVSEDCKKFLTRAGEERVDWLQLCDNDQNPINYQGKIEVFLEHANRLVVLKPQILKDETRIGLKWTPKIRGHYHLYINKVLLNPTYEIGVCAGQADFLNSRAQAPKQTAICFFEDTEVNFVLKDQFGNIYSQLEEEMLGDELIIEIIGTIEKSQEEAEKKIPLKTKKSIINKYGQKKVKVQIDVLAANHTKIELIVDVRLNCEQILQFKIIVEGSALNERLKTLGRQIESITKKHYRELSIHRNRFIEDLFAAAQMSMHYIVTIKFVNEPGYDAGGLKREFYDMIGNEMKSPENPFFIATDKRKQDYFLNPDILKNKKRFEYMKLWGKFLGNSILNTYLLGISFSPVFIKLLYGHDIDFNDMLLIITEEEAHTYQYLLNAPADAFEDLYLYFSFVVDKSKGIEQELKPNGKNIPVTKQNIYQYLNLLSKAKIVDRYQEIVTHFKEGLESVIPLNVLSKYVRPDEFWSLTKGTKEVTPELVIDYINFTGTGIETITGWFRRFIMQSTEQVLLGFLKFSSGSSSIDFGMTSKINVEFEASVTNTKKLPISHTCWKQIVVPKYKSYDIMKQLLNAAFIYCSEGFGFG